MKDRPYVRATISPKAERTLLSGHPWIYEGEIVSFSGECVNGDLADVVGEKGNYLGTGFFNDNSKIRIRIISRNANDVFDGDFYARRVRYAWQYRKKVMDDVSSCRVIFGEADFLPGVTVDKFGDILVSQITSLGTEGVKDKIYAALVAALAEDGIDVAGIFERNDVPLRSREGLNEYVGWYDIGKPLPESERTLITENGVTYNVDFGAGQKTGYFLDQKYNRRLVAALAGGAEVFDCFTHTGSFALNAVRGGAKSVLAADISESALDTARENAALNGASDKIEFRAADAFELLPELEAAKKKFDLVVLDPPAFAKSRKNAESALRGYGEINCRGMKLVRRGGYLATCTCSHFAAAEDFASAVRGAAVRAGVSLRQVWATRQSPDHPILQNVPETDYLKFFVFQVV